jgi:hypothetical protein
MELQHYPIYWIGQCNHDTGPITVMSRDLTTLLLRQACRLRWPGRHVAELANLTKRPKGTAASWLAGRRGMPAPEMQLLANVLRDAGRELASVGAVVSHSAELKRSQGRRARGFQVVKDWDGTGIMRDARWHGGRRGKNKALTRECER